jgi:hypothetical protein
MHHLYNAYILVSTGMHRPFRASALDKTGIFRLIHLFIVRGKSIDSHETDPKTTRPLSHPVNPAGTVTSHLPILA